ncbi:MAG: flagellar basal body P-ring formation protein FlgA [Deltaproteobacteria bacterium]|nr:flagellar basal body P-ring formation protein FlgA [Deltaproteobacteria bacterium]TLN04809.1 MAG: flagellar basal body P-ring formation protein FlgA [bacterium]
MKKFSAVLFLMVLAWCLGGSVTAQAGGTTLSAKKVRAAVQDFILDRTRDSGMEIRIKRIALEEDIVIPAGKVRYEFIAPRQWEGWGRTVIGMVIRVDDQLVKNMSIPVEVEALTDMVVALFPLPRGAVVEASDVSLQKRDLAEVSGKVSFNLDDVLGKRVRVPIRANTPVRSDYLEKLPLVKNGQMVTIVAENGDLRVTATGMARGAGAEGDLIMVQNMNSKKSVQARVIDAGTVAVNF